MVSSRDVATRAGVSRSTVSQVLNGHEHLFANHTVSRVQEAAEALGYRPSSAARTLARGTSDVIITLLPNITFGPRLRELVDALTAGLKTHGFTNLLRLSTASNAIDDAILGLRPHAVISLGPLPRPDLERLRRHGVLVVEQTNAVQERIDIAIGRRQAEHLASRGYKAIVVALPTDLREYRFAPPRAAGVHEWCLRKGLQILPTMHIDLEQAGAVQSVQNLPDVQVGVAAYNDEVALSVLSASHLVGRPIPSKIGIIGVDNSRIARICAPTLTTIDFDLEYSAEQLLDLIVRGEEQMKPDDVREVEERLTVLQGGSTAATVF